MEKVIKIPFKITGEFVDDVMCTALNGGINYWCCDILCNDKKGASNLSDVISAGGIITLIDEDDNYYDLDFNKFCEGFERYISWCLDNNVIAYTDTSEIDAVIADIIIQFSLFKKVIFG